MREDGSLALVSAVVMEDHAYGTPHFVVPRGLTSGARYRDAERGVVYDADALMEVGIPLPMTMKAGSYRAFTYLLERV